MRTGNRPSASEAGRAKCCECLANFSDGRIDCKQNKCPLYSYHPYRNLKPNYDWVFGKWARTNETARLALGISKIEYVKQYVMKNGKVSRMKCYRAKCFRCMGDFSDGRVDCKIQSCQIYYWMPYRELLPTYDWLFDLSYTKRHKEYIFLNSMTRSEYVNMIYPLSYEENYASI